MSYLDILRKRIPVVNCPLCDNELILISLDQKDRNFALVCHLGFIQSHYKISIIVNFGVPHWHKDKIEILDIEHECTFEITRYFNTPSHAKIKYSKSKDVIKLDNISILDYCDLESVKQTLNTLYVFN